RVFFALDDVRGVRRLGEPVRAHPEARLVMVNTYDQALNFYSRHRGIVIDGVTELEFGRQYAPDVDVYFQSIRALPALVAQSRPTFYFVSRADWPQLMAVFAGRAHVVAEQRKHLLLFAPGGSDVAQSN